MDNTIFATSNTFMDSGVNFVPEAVHGFGYSWQNAYNGLAQLTRLPELHLLDEHKNLTGSDWAAQQLGNGLGIASQFWLLEKGIGRATGLAKAGTVTPFGRELAIQASAGLLYGGFLTPIDKADTRPEWLARVENAAILGTAIPVMGIAGRGVRGMSTSYLARPVSTSLASTYLARPMARLFSTEVASGFASGVPGGLWYTAGKGIAEQRVPEWSEWRDNLTNFSLVGLGLGATKGF